MPFSRIHKKPPDEMWFANLTYPVWVAKYGEEYDEIDNIELRDKRNS